MLTQLLNLKLKMFVPYFLEKTFGFVHVLVEFLLFDHITIFVQVDNPTAISLYLLPLTCQSSSQLCQRTCSQYLPLRQKRRNFLILTIFTPIIHRINEVDPGIVPLLPDILSRFSYQSLPLLPNSVLRIHYQLLYILQKSRSDSCDRLVVIPVSNDP